MLPLPELVRSCHKDFLMLARKIAHGAGVAMA